MNTSYPSQVLHIISADAENVIKTGNEADDLKNSVASNSMIDFDVQKYLGGPVKSPGRNIHVVATVMSARFPFSFYTTDNRNNNVWLYWTGNAAGSSTRTSANAVLLRPRDQIDKIRQNGSIPSYEDDGLRNGTYTWEEWIDMLNETFASYAGLTAADRDQYPLYWLQNYRFIHSAAQMNDAEYGFDPATARVAPDPNPTFFRAAQNTYYVPLVQKHNPAPNADDLVTRVTFMFRDPRDRDNNPDQQSLQIGREMTLRAATSQFGMRPVDEATIVPYVVQNPAVPLTDENRLITKYPMSHLGGLFEQIYVRADFLTHISTQTNVLQTIPVSTDRFYEIIFQGGANSTPRMLNLENPNILKIRFDVTDRLNRPLNFRTGNWAMTVRFDFVRQDAPQLNSMFSPSAQLAAAKKRRLDSDDRRARGLPEDDDGVDTNPSTEVDDYDRPQNPATTRYSRLLG